MAIGLQFICETYGIEYKKLAEKLDTTPQNINAWLREKRKIPSKRLEQLTNFFPNIPSELFNKELSSSEKILIQETYFTETDQVEEIEYEDIDDEGNIYFRSKAVSHHEGIINHLRNEYERQVLLEQFEELISDDSGNFHINEKLMSRFAAILSGERDSREYQLLKMMFYFLQQCDEDFGFGSDPDLMPSAKYKEMYKEIGEVLKKHSLINQT